MYITFASRNIVAEKRKTFLCTYCRHCCTMFLPSRGILLFELEETQQNNNNFLFTIPSNPHLWTYIPVLILYIFRVTIPALILNAIISRHILTLDTAHVSATRLQTAAALDRAWSLARTGKEFQDLFRSLLRSKPHKFHGVWDIIYLPTCPGGKGTTGSDTMALLQITAW